ncbi:MAG TPA: response regulator [Chthoniobacteraceae bacterium]|nr:response regulator [Chthoniobacteraceae bacterium]
MTQNNVYETSFHILLVEDSVSQATKITYILEREGLEVSWAATAEAAFRKMREEKHDLILLDFYLPGMRGDEVCRRIRMNIDRRNTPIIILTAEETSEAELRGLDSGADDFVSKSADSDVLLLRIRTLLHKVRRQSDILTAPKNHFRAARLLAIDDSVTFLERLRPELESEGYEVECSYNGTGGLERLASGCFDAVIIDVVMPGMDGIELCRRIDELRKKNQSSLVTVILSGYESKEDLSRALEAGADDFVGKSSDLAVLKGRIRALLRRKFFEEENRQILHELKTKEMEAIQERTAKEAAEARAVLADELQKTTQELKLSQAKLQQAGKAKDQFLAILSHELRTPLTPVLAVVTDRCGNPEIPVPIREDFAMIKRNIELEARLIDDLLDLTRITRNKLELNAAPTDLFPVLEHAIKICCPPESSGRIPRIDVEFEAENRVVWGDASRLSQVLWNLLRNAVKFTPVEGRITVRGYNAAALPGKNQEALVIEVIDTGIGVEKEMLTRIFDAFEQGGRQVTRQFGGLGLGLAISHAIVELHHGVLTAESPGKGKGTTFRLVLPVSSIPEAAELILPICSTERTPAEGSAGERATHILLVEDHLDTSRALQRLLTRRGHRVTPAHDVRSALKLAATSGPFDLLISDLGLPDGSGLDLIRQMLKIQPVRGIALTGFGMDDDVNQSQEAGFDLHLIKPVDMAVLESAISDLVSRK